MPHFTIGAITGMLNEFKEPVWVVYAAYFFQIVGGIGAAAYFGLKHPDIRVELIELTTDECLEIK